MFMEFIMIHACLQCLLLQYKFLREKRKGMARQRQQGQELNFTLILNVFKRYRI